MTKWVRSFLGHERVRFLLVGGINTVFGYGLFALLYQVFGGAFSYLGVLVITYCIASLVNFYSYRRFVFSANGRPVRDYLAFVLVSLVSLAVNGGVLVGLVERFAVSVLIAQGISTFIAVIVTYLGHKYFSFNRGLSQG